MREKYLPFLLITLFAAGTAIKVLLNPIEAAATNDVDGKGVPKPLIVPYSTAYPEFPPPATPTASLTPEETATSTPEATAMVTIFDSSVLPPTPRHEATVTPIPDGLSLEQSILPEKDRIYTLGPDRRLIFKVGTPGNKIDVWGEVQPGPGIDPNDPEAVRYLLFSPDQINDVRNWLTRADKPPAPKAILRPGTAHNREVSNVGNGHFPLDGWTLIVENRSRVQASLTVGFKDQPAACLDKKGGTIIEEFGDVRSWQTCDDELLKKNGINVDGN